VLKSLLVDMYNTEINQQNKPLVIFGTGDIAQLAHYYFTRDSVYTVAAFTVDAAWMPELTDSPTFCGLPIVAFEQLSALYPPETHDLFIALGYRNLNQLRREKYLLAKAQNYRLASYLSSRAVLLNDGDIGDNCFILENTIVQPFTSIGNNVTLWSGCMIAHHSIVRDHCFLSSCGVAGGVDVGEACFIGGYAILRDKIRVGARCVIGAGALLLADAEPEGVYMGTASERSVIPSTRLKGGYSALPDYALFDRSEPVDSFRLRAGQIPQESLAGEAPEKNDRSAACCLVQA
jgi:sugar O-acyltransferase (sialic acid O-acetyltransferase NeuD family)